MAVPTTENKEVMTMDMAKFYYTQKHLEKLQALEMQHLKIVNGLQMQKAMIYSQYLQEFDHGIAEIDKLYSMSKSNTPITTSPSTRAPSRSVSIQHQPQPATSVPALPPAPKAKPLPLPIPQIIPPIPRQIQLQPQPQAQTSTNASQPIQRCMASTFS